VLERPGRARTASIPPAQLLLWGELCGQAIRGVAFEGTV
jgi:hypothetical protein